MSGNKTIALIGGRGAGKSKISRKLGKRLGRLVLSTDALIGFEAGGLTTASIVEQEGWQGFRDREYNILARCASMPGIVLDCGGGMPVDLSANGEEIFSERKAQLLREHTFVIYIKRNMDWLLSRGLADANRPGLSADYRALLERRLPWYERLADAVLEMDNRSVPQGVEWIVTRLANRA